MSPEEMRAAVLLHGLGIVISWKWSCGYSGTVVEFRRDGHLTVEVLDWGRRTVIRWNEITGVAGAGVSESVNRETSSCPACRMATAALPRHELKAYCLLCDDTKRVSDEVSACFMLGTTDPGSQVEGLRLVIDSGLLHYSGHIRGRLRYIEIVAHDVKHQFTDPKNLARVKAGGITK